MKSVLIVEDDDLLGRMYTKLLENAGYKVDLQVSGAGALTALSSSKFDLILLDIMLGGDMNGFDVLEKVRKNQKLAETKVIIATNLDSEEKVATEIGVDGYFSKTKVKPEEILDKIIEIIGK